MAFLFVRSYPELHNNFDSDVDSTTIVVETLKDTAKHLFSQVSSSTTRDNYVRKFQSDHTPVKRGLPCRMGRGYQGQVGRGRRYQGRRGCGCRYQGRIGIGWDQWTEAHLWDMVPLPWAGANFGIIAPENVWPTISRKSTKASWICGYCKFWQTQTRMLPSTSLGIPISSILANLYALYGEAKTTSSSDKP